jgi:hypothetical protein
MPLLAKNAFKFTFATAVFGDVLGSTIVSLAQERGAANHNVNVSAVTILW